MASVIREMTINAAPEKVWQIVSDFVSGPLRTSPGVFVDSRLVEPGLRALTFADGRVVKERLIARDDERRRIVWSWVDESVVHDNTSMQVFPAADGTTRLVWIHDTLPDSHSEWLAAAMDQLAPVISKSLEAA